MTRSRRADGFALVAVLWILLVIGVVGATFQAGARAERRAVANARAESRTRWAGRAGLALALSRLDSVLWYGGEGIGLRTSGDTVLRPIEFRSGGVTVGVVMLDAGARVNLNLGTGRQLAALSGAVGLSPASATTLAARVLDWRDADAARRPYGAETETYAGLRPPSRPKNAPFERVEELRQVYGVTPALYARLAPHVTVAGDGRINVNAAPVPVLVTLPGIDADAARSIVARRSGAPYRNVFELLSSLPRGTREWIETDLDRFMDAVAFGPRVVLLAVTARADGSPVVPGSRRRWSSSAVPGGGCSAWRRRDGGLTPAAPRHRPGATSTSSSSIRARSDGAGSSGGTPGIVTARRACPSA